jgi:hypothetical protein
MSHERFGLDDASHALMCHEMASQRAFHGPISACRRCDDVAAEVTFPADSSEGRIPTEVCPTSAS